MLFRSRYGQYQERFEAALVSLGLVPGDPITLVEFADRVRAAPSFAVEARLAQSRMRSQLTAYESIEQARLDFLGRLRSSRGVR